MKIAFLSIHFTSKPYLLSLIFYCIVFEYVSNPLKCWLFYNFIISLDVFLMVDTLISGLWWSWSRYFSIDPPMQCTSVDDVSKETKISVPISPQHLGKSMTVFWLELSSKVNNLSSKASYVSHILSTKSTQQNHGITVNILKNSFPHKKTCLYHQKITVLTVMH